MFRLRPIFPRFACLFPFRPPVPVSCFAYLFPFRLFVPVSPTCSRFPVSPVCSRFAHLFPFPVSPVCSRFAHLFPFPVSPVCTRFAHLFPFPVSPISRFPFRLFVPVSPTCFVPVSPTCFVPVSPTCSKSYGFCGDYFIVSTDRQNGTVLGIGVYCPVSHTVLSITSGRASTDTNHNTFKTLLMSKIIPQHALNNHNPRKDLNNVEREYLKPVFHAADSQHENMYQSHLTTRRVKEKSKRCYSHKRNSGQ